jgi:hypothetical protein
MQTCLQVRLQLVAVILSLQLRPTLIDDLFGDAGDVSNTKSPEPVPSSASYLDADWKLSDEDQKEFKGFGKKEDIDEEADPEIDSREMTYPCFALMYRLRKEYVDQSIDTTLADHNAYCTRFKRLINSEVISLRNKKGLVLLWAGLAANDKPETRAEIKQFLDGDPLLEKGMVEKWDIIDLEHQADKLKAGEASSTATTTT